MISLNIGTDGLWKTERDIKDFTDKAIIFVHRELEDDGTTCS